MQKRNWYITVAVALLALSGIVYYFHLLLFRDVRHIFIYMVGDLAFLPLEVLIVTVIIDRLLKAREKSLLFEKMKMFVSSFYSEMGSELIRKLLPLDESKEEKMALFSDVSGWESDEFGLVKSKLSMMSFTVRMQPDDVVALGQYLSGKREFLLRLLENPYLVEEESLSDLLWAVFHLTDELEARRRLRDFSSADIEHLSGDVTRVYELLVRQWLDYMAHLEIRYPYLFSLAVRLNPFNPEASAVVV